MCIRTLLQVLLCLAAVVFGMVQAEEDGSDVGAVSITMPLSVVGYDLLFLQRSNGPIKCQILSEEGGKVSYALFDRPNVTHTVDQAQVVRIVRGHDAETTARVRGQQCLATENWLELERTISWAREHELVEVALELARGGAKARPETLRFTEIVLELELALEQWDAAEATITDALTRHPTWYAGYAKLVDLYQRQQRPEDLARTVDAWLAANSTSIPANRLKLEQLLAEGRLEEAAEPLRRLSVNKDPLAVVLKLWLDLGEYRPERIQERLVELRAQGIERTADLAIVEGSLALRSGELAQARQQLEAGLAGTPPPHPILLAAAHYNLGLAYYRLGETEKARLHWEQTEHPLAELGRGMITDAPLDTATQDRELAYRLRAHNAIVAIQHGEAERALESLDPSKDRRHAEIARYATLLASKGQDETTMRLLRRDQSLEAQRWACYGSILQGDFEEAYAISQSLPEDDPYSVLYRAFLAKSLGQEQDAERHFARLQLLGGVPQDYFTELATVFDEQYDREEVITFDWVDGERGILGPGWQSEAFGTHIRIYAANQLLHFEGTQASDRGGVVSRAVVQRSLADLRRIRYALDVGANGRGGLELIDLERRDGIAIALTSEGAVEWRRLIKQEWQPWQRLASNADSGGAISLYFDPTQIGRNQIVLELDPDRQFALASLDLFEERTCFVSLFALAQGNERLHVIGSELRFQRRGE